MTIFKIVVVSESCHWGRPVVHNFFATLLSFALSSKMHFKICYREEYDRFMKNWLHGQIYLKLGTLENFATAVLQTAGSCSQEILVVMWSLFNLQLKPMISAMAWKKPFQNMPWINYSVICQNQLEWSKNVMMQEEIDTTSNWQALLPWRLTHLLFSFQKLLTNPFVEEQKNFFLSMKRSF